MITAMTTTNGQRWLLRGGTVHDGLGSPGRRADVLVVDDRIAEVGTAIDATGATPVDCDGLLVCPGFIDAHAHSDAVHLDPEPQPFKVMQGVTTEIVGNCGISFAPLTDEAVDDFRRLYGELAGSVPIEPGTMGELMDRVAATGPSNNLAFLVGHGTVRLSANGLEPKLRPGALERMQQLVAEAFEAGALGLSSGLIYVPGTYGDTDELVALASVAATYGGLYTTHMRDEGTHVTDSLDEAFSIGRRAGVSVQISHCKAAGHAAHGLGEAIVERIESARNDGLDVLGDQYPYSAGSTVLLALLPSAASSGGSGELRRRLSDTAERERLHSIANAGGAGAGVWHQVTPADVMLASHVEEGMAGRTLVELSAGRDPWDVLCDLVLADPGAVIVLEMMDEADVRRIMSSPLVGIGSDNGPPHGMQHPRTWGCFPHLLGTYVRELGVIT